MLHDPQTAFGLIGLGLPCVSRATVRAPTAALRAGEGPWRPLKAYLFLVADCALRSACSAHAIHAAAISINIASSFSDTRCAKRRHSAAYCRKRLASLSMGRLRPDFSFIDDAGNVILWEHLGRLDRADYREGWEWKRQWYAQNGFAEGRNLFTSTEVQIRDMDFIDKTAKTIQVAIA